MERYDLQLWDVSRHQRRLAAIHALRRPWPPMPGTEIGARAKPEPKGPGRRTRSPAQTTPRLIHRSSAKSSIRVSRNSRETTKSELTDVPVDVLEEFRHTRQIGLVTSKVELRALRTFFAYFVSCEWITANAAKEIKGPRNIRPNEVVPYTLREESLSVVHRGTAPITFQTAQNTVPVTPQAHENSGAVNQ